MNIIFDAVDSGVNVAVRRAIADDADVKSALDNEGKTPLHWAAYNGKTEITRLLIESGANVDAVDKYGVTPLMQACDGGFVETARLLIESGANVNAVDGNLETVIDNISRFSQPEIFALLRDAGAKTRLELRAEKYAGNA